MITILCWGLVIFTLVILLLHRTIKDYERKEEILDKQLAENQKKESLILEQAKDVDDKIATLKNLQSSTYALPYMASIIADFDTRGIEALAVSLDWGESQERRKKVRSIREIRREAKELIAQYKTAQYQLDYAIKMFPALEDFLDTEYGDLPEVNMDNLSSEEHDTVRDYLSREEYANLTTIQRNQLALDRYRASRRKSKWQIGRDYELYIGYLYEKKGYRVDYFGSRKKLDDLGRDLIATKDGTTLIIQCKYWSSRKQIHENHINQLYGTMMCYAFEHHLPPDAVRGVLVTNITLSDTARKFSGYLGIELAENVPLKEHPCIKCNINHSHEEGTTHIYHLPFDQMYDACQISLPGEFMAMTVAEAEAAGFRRAYRWHGES